MSNEIKEIFETLSTRIRSPFFGYAFFISIFMNWKAWFYLFFENETVLNRIDYFEAHTSLDSTIISPLILAFLAALSAPWIRLFFVWLVRKPTILKNILQARAESKILEEKGKLERERINYLNLEEKRINLEEEIIKLKEKSVNLEEERIIAQAKHDSALKALEDEKIREQAQQEIKKLRGQNSDTTEVQVKLKKQSSGNGYEFYLTNSGDGLAHNVNLRVRTSDGQQNPLPIGYNKMFPIEKLVPDQNFSMRVNLPNVKGVEFDVIVTWENSDGSKGKTLSTLSV